MHENEVSHRIIDTAIRIHRQVGPGLLESAYQMILSHKLAQIGLAVKQQVFIPLVFEDIYIKKGFYADMIVEDQVIVELKSVEKIAPIHTKQLLTYLRLTHKKLGLLLNFGEVYMKNGICRLVNGL